MNAQRHFPAAVIAIVMAFGSGRDTDAALTWVEVTTETEFAVTTKGNVDCDDGISSAYRDTYSVEVEERNRGGFVLHVHGEIRSGSGIGRADLIVAGELTGQRDDSESNKAQAFVRAEISQVRDGYTSRDSSSLIYDFGPDDGSLSGSLRFAGTFPEGDLVFGYRRPQGLIDRMTCSGAGIVEVEFLSTFTQ